jgi:hypothetical protein
MQAFSNLLIENRALMIGAAAVAFFVAAVLILLVFRLAFGRRLRMASGRARQMRLGIVDAFDLDRQRQLVIVRRDNVEHLVMIGGPNDILIESQIIRTEARSRDKDVRDKDSITVSAKTVGVEPKVGMPPLPEQLSAAASDEIPPARAPMAPTLPPAAAPRRMMPSLKKPTDAPAVPPVHAEAPAKPTVQKPAPAATQPPQPIAAPPVIPTPVAPPPVAPAPVSSAPVVEPPKPAADQPSFLRWPARTPAAPQSGKPAKMPPEPPPLTAAAPTIPPAAIPPSVMPPAAIPPAPGPLPATPPFSASRAPKPAPAAAPAPEAPPAFPPVPSMEGLESLEEEMAKLLGRGPGKP